VPLVAITLALIVGCAEQDFYPSADVPQDLILSGVTVVDTASGKLTPNMTIVINDGVITSVSPEPAPDSSKLRIKLRIDATGKFLVPGYLDMHAHTLQSKSLKGDLSLMLANGITGFRQMAGSAAMIRQVKAGSFSPTAAPTPLLVPGPVLFPQLARSPEAVVEEIQKQHAFGADFIKMVDTGPQTFYAALAEAKRLGTPMVGHVPVTVNVLEAAQRGMKSIEHLGPASSLFIGCSSDEAAIRRNVAESPPEGAPVLPTFLSWLLTPILDHIIERAIANPMLMSGSAGIKFMQQLDDTYDDKKCSQLAAALAATDTWQVPTLIRISTMHSGDDPRYMNDPNLRYVSQERRKLWSSVARDFSKKISLDEKKTLQEFFALQMKFVEKLNSAGVKMLAGTDVGGQWVVPGFSLHQEFDFLEAAGLSPLKVLQMTTLNGAIFLGRQDTMGSVAPGKVGDLVLLNANPIESVQNLHRIYAVVRNGKYYGSDALGALVKETENR